MMGAMVWHLAKYSLAWFLSTYLSWQMVMTPGKMEIFPQQATDVGKLRAHNREAWLGDKDQVKTTSPTPDQAFFLKAMLRTSKDTLARFWAGFESRQNCLNCSISLSVALMSPVSASRGSNIELISSSFSFSFLLVLVLPM